MFLSVCPTEIGHFVPNLDRTLSSQFGIVVFGEDERFQHGEQVESTLNVIRECKVAIIVFTKEYANSSSCIKELEKITECARTSDLIVLPVFYHGVYPSLGSLNGSSMFGEAFVSFLHRISMEEDKFMTWVASITQATKYLGLSDFVHKPIYR